MYKYLLRTKGDEMAAQAAAYMQQDHLIDLDLSITLAAATHGPPMADSLICATAQRHRAAIWTQDVHFEGLPGVKYFPK